MTLHTYLALHSVATDYLTMRGSYIKTRGYKIIYGVALLQLLGFYMMKSNGMSLTNFLKALVHL
ncbi:hypothetical protein HZS_1562 [Henneguya salminicola]|nr:hypothetical protein HZS_1562 [Henneguya salminicola]